MQQSLSTLTTTQFADISPIAHQCHLEGGSAVYMARDLYMLNEQGNFDDLSICGLGVAERNIHQAVMQPYDGIALQPNPASLQVMISLPQRDDNDTFLVKITDLNGATVLNDRIPVGAKTLMLDVSSLPVGIYICSVTGSSKAFSPVKFVVLH